MCTTKTCSCNPLIRLSCGVCGRRSLASQWLNAGECPNCAVGRDTIAMEQDEQKEEDLMNFLEEFPTQISEWIQELYHYHKDGLCTYYGQPKEWLKNLHFSGYINETVCIALCMTVDNPFPGPADPGRYQ